jgi:anti-sigma regulatory factor (Ser/Thr protein kinase)
VFPEGSDGAFPLVAGSLKVRTNGLGLTGEVTEASVLMLPFTTSSVGVARRRLVSDLIAAGIYDSSVCDAALVVSELLSNALRHAEPLPGAEIRVAWSFEADAIQVTVCDGGSETAPVLGHPTQAATGGRGLRIVEQLSTRWGTSRDDEGTTVWARVPVARATTEMTTVGGPAVATERAGSRPD